MKFGQAQGKISTFETRLNFAEQKIKRLKREVTLAREEGKEKQKALERQVELAKEKTQEK